MKRSKKRRRFLYAAGAAVLILGLWGGADREAAAVAPEYEDITHLKVTVGYSFCSEQNGGYVKGDVDLDVLAEACGVHQEIYTWIDRSNSCGTTEAEGIYLYDLLDYFDISTESVDYYNFHTQDAGSYDGAWVQWTGEDLNCQYIYTLASQFQRILDEQEAADPDDYEENPQNYFTLADLFVNDEVTGVGTYTETAWDMREEVQPMLALRRKDHRWVRSDLFALDFSELDDSMTPVLLFGQPDRFSQIRHNEAHSVDGILIWFPGYPEITGDATELSGQVGDVQHLNIQVSTPDAALTEGVKGDLQWQSDDESVATVDEYGNVTFVGEGEANISVSYNGHVGYSVGVASSGEGSGGEPGSGGSEGEPGSGGSGEEGTGGGSGGESGSGGSEGGTGGGGTEEDPGEDPGDPGEDPGSGESEDPPELPEQNELLPTDISQEQPTVLQFARGEVIENQEKAEPAEVNKTQEESSQEEADTSEETAMAGGGSGGSSGGEVRVYELMEQEEDVEENMILEETQQKGIFVVAVCCIAAGMATEGIHFSSQKGRRKQK